MGKLKNGLQAIVNLFGLELKRISNQEENVSDSIKAILPYWEIIQPNTMCSKAKIGNLFSKVKYCIENKIEGDFVECGVWKGGSVAIMAAACLEYKNEKRNLQLFDSFDDLCEPNPDIDGQQAVEDVKLLLQKTQIKKLEGKLKPIKGIYDSRGGFGTIEECEKLIIDKIKFPKEQIFFHKGWFQETLQSEDLNINKIALLRIDADWYESTKVCLDKLYDKVSPRGFVIIDDYGRYEGCKKAVDEFIEAKNLNIYLHYSDFSSGECRYFIKP